MDQVDSLGNFQTSTLRKRQKPRMRMSHNHLRRKLMHILQLLTSEMLRKRQ